MTPDDNGTLIGIEAELVTLSKAVIVLADVIEAGFNRLVLATLTASPVVEDVTTSYEWNEENA